MDVVNFWHFDIGNVVTVVGGIISIVIVWQKMSDKVENLGERLVKQEQDVDQLAKLGIITTVNQHERRLSQVELMVSDIGSIKTDISWMKSRMEKRSGD